MRWLDNTLLTLAIIGCIVWGLIGFFQFNLVSFIFGDGSWLSRIIYALVGLSEWYKKRVATCNPLISHNRKKCIL